MKTKLFLLLAFVFAWGHVQAQLCTSPPVEAPLFYSMSGNIVCGPQQSMFMLTNWPGAGFEVEWDFGDGMTSVQQSPMHMYTVPGNYTVTARYKNIGEACYSDYYTMVMTVYPPVPMPEFDFFTPMSCEGAPYELTLDAMSWPIGTCTLHVNFGDGTPPIERISSTPVTGIKHTYTSSPGSFPVSAFFSTMDTRPANN
jgi:PKD repeat protein